MTVVVIIIVFSMAVFGAFCLGARIASVRASSVLADATIRALDKSGLSKKDRLLFIYTLTSELKKNRL